MEFSGFKVGYKEKGCFETHMTVGRSEILFLHFLTPAEISLDGISVRVGKGGCILCPPLTVLSLLPERSSPLYDSFRLTGIRDDMIKKYGLAFRHVYFPPNSECVSAIVTALEEEQTKKATFYDGFSALKFEELLILLARSDISENRPSVNEKTYAQFVKLRQEIRRSYDKGLTVEQMADMAGLSPSRFYSVYKSIFGVSPKKDYLAIRIEHAKALLRQGGISVAQAARMLGYTNPYHFIRQFKEAVGVSPGKYQKTSDKDSINDKKSDSRE